MGQSTTADRGFGFTVPSTGSRRPGLSYPFSSSSPTHRRAQTDFENVYYLPKPLSRPKSASNLLSTTSDFYGHDLANTLDVGDDVKARREKDDIAALIDFLKNHAPPADNFMSIPFGCGGVGDKGRWSARLRNMAKRRTNSLSQVTQHLHLPDSAVSGVTTGGHRHIAISIPLDASPFGEMPRTQYPVFPNYAQPSIPPQRSPSTRTYLSDKGVVTVLRPVTEVIETPTITPEGSQPGLPRENKEHMAEQVSKGTQSSASGRKSHAHQKHQDYTHGALQRAVYPSRASGKTSNRGSNHPISIDSLLSQSTKQGASPKSNHGDYQRSIADSVATNGEEPVVGEAVQARSCKSSPVLVSERDSQMRYSSQNQSISTVITESPIASRMERGSSSTRRERVREKRRRDMEAILNGTDKKRSPNDNCKRQESGAGINADERPHTRHGMQRSESDFGWQYNSQPGNTSASEFKLCPIMVVMDVRPSSPSDERSARRQLRTPPSGKSVASVHAAGNPTPPVSPSGSPLKKLPSMDRISLSRRREWKASRENDQRKQGAMAAAARAKAHPHTTASAPGERVRGSQTEKEIVRLYEAFREHRFRDMERRVRRLERNGDIWLQALLPMLENMNQTMAQVQDEQNDSMRDWASDDEGAGSAERRGRSTERRPLLRESGSHGRLVENLVRRRDETESGTDSITRSDDTTGLGLIDSLMKELAGETTREGQNDKAAPGDD